jgi:hypothetical protein
MRQARAAGQPLGGSHLDIVVRTEALIPNSSGAARVVIDAD